jgi:hypothetical protein
MQNRTCFFLFCFVFLLSLSFFLFSFVPLLFCHCMLTFVLSMSSPSHSINHVYRYCFARNHLALQIAERDVHLVGELIEVLRCFGVTDEDPLIRAGMAFLLANQNEDGLWDADKDPYTVLVFMRGRGVLYTSIHSAALSVCVSLSH